MPLNINKNNTKDLEINLKKFKFLKTKLSELSSTHPDLLICQNKHYNSSVEILTKVTFTGKYNAILYLTDPVSILGLSNYINVTVSDFNTLFDLLVFKEIQPFIHKLAFDLQPEEMTTILKTNLPYTSKLINPDNINFLKSSNYFKILFFVNTWLTNSNSKLNITFDFIEDL